MAQTTEITSSFSEIFGWLGNFLVPIQSQTGLEGLAWIETSMGALAQLELNWPLGRFFTIVIYLFIYLFINLSIYSSYPTVHLCTLYLYIVNTEILFKEGHSQ